MGVTPKDTRTYNPRVAGSSPAGPTIQFGAPPNLFPTSKLNGNNYTDRTCDQGGDVFSGGIAPPKSKRGVTATQRVAPSGERQLPYGERSDERLRGEQRRRSVRVLLGPPQHLPTIKPNWQSKQVLFRKTPGSSGQGRRRFPQGYAHPRPEVWTLH